MEANKVKINVKGKFIWVDSELIEDKIVIIIGEKIKIAKIKDEWYESVENPEAIIKFLKKSRTNPDMFTFWQRLPEIKPKYNYYMEWEAISAVHVSTYYNWWNNQISGKVRQTIRKAYKKGVEVKIVEFNDNLVKGIAEIFNETPIRRGKPFWHYGKDIYTIKKEMSQDLDRSNFLGAYYKGELIGFIKLIYADKYVTPVEAISKIEHRDKSPNNALIAKAVDICSSKKIPYLTYGNWRKESHADFLSRNGFVKILLPRYYIPLTLKGKLILTLRLHRGIKGILPNILYNFILFLRIRFYTIKNSLCS